MATGYLACRDSSCSGELRTSNVPVEDDRSSAGR